MFAINVYRPDAGFHVVARKKTGLNCLRHTCI